MEFVCTILNDDVAIKMISVPNGGLTKKTLTEVSILRLVKACIRDINMATSCNPNIVTLAWVHAST